MTLPTGKSKNERARGFLTLIRGKYYAFGPTLFRMQ
jgi:hypothetical protein